MMKFSLINSKTKYLFISLILFLAFLTQSWFSSQSNEFLRVIGIKDGDTVVLLTAARQKLPSVYLKSMPLKGSKPLGQFPVLFFLTLFLEKKLSWKNWVQTGTVVLWDLFICAMVLTLI